MAKKRKAFKKPSAASKAKAEAKAAAAQDQAGQTPIAPDAEGDAGVGGPPAAGPAAAATGGAPMTDDMRMRARYGG